MRTTCRQLLVVLCLVPVAACDPPKPDTRELRYVDVQVNEPTELDLPEIGSSMWADVDHAETVRCVADGPDGEPEYELQGHYTQYNTSIPVERDGTEYLQVGKFEHGGGQVTVECSGSDGTDLYAALPVE